jgi:hypothetical protein
MKSFKGYEPIEAPRFELESPDGKRKLEVVCKGAIPGSMFLDFLAKTKEEDPSTLAVAMQSILQAAIRDDQWEAFKEFVDNPDNGVSIELLSEIAGYLSELYAGRPTAPSGA